MYIMCICILSCVELKFYQTIMSLLHGKHNLHDIRFIRQSAYNCRPLLHSYICNTFTPQIKGNHWLT